MTRGNLWLAASLPSLAFLALGCVPKAKYDFAVQDAASTHAKLDDTNRQKDAFEARIVDLGRQIADLEARTEEQAEHASDATVQGHNLQASLDEQTAINEQLRRELSRLGRNVEDLLSEKGGLSQSLEQAKARLEELRRVESATEARAALARELTRAFDKNIAARELSLSFVSGRLFVTVSADTLFEPNRPRLLPSARPLVKRVADVLRGLQGRHFEVGVHTDVAPKGRAGSTWDLSTARASELVQALVANGVAADSLSASGYAEFAPIDRSGTPEAKARNQRVEITLIPKAEELLSVASPSLSTPPPQSPAAVKAPPASKPPASLPAASSVAPKGHR